MNDRTLSSERVLELKREAAALKAAERINHTSALARIAHREGYRSWEELIGLSGGSDALKEYQHAKVPTESQQRRADRKARYGSK